jgi:hypothetical protein
MGVERQVPSQHSCSCSAHLMHLMNFVRACCVVCKSCSQSAELQACAYHTIKLACGRSCVGPSHPLSAHLGQALGHLVGHVAHAIQHMDLGTLV